MQPAFGRPGISVREAAESPRVQPRGVSTSVSKPATVRPPTDEVPGRLLEPHNQPFSRAMRTASARLRTASFWIAIER